MANPRSWTRGYPELAAIMGTSPGLAIFRRFATLNAKNLLYLQSELVELEWDMRNIEKNDTDNGALLTKSIEVRAKLKEYNELLLVHRQLYQLPKADERQLGLIRHLLSNPACWNGALDISENKIWDRASNGEEDGEFVSLSAQKTRWYNNRFANWLDRRACLLHLTEFLFKLHLWFRQKVLKTGVEADDDDILAHPTLLRHELERVLACTTAILSIMFASTLSPASIWIIYYIRDMEFRLLFVLVASAVFSALVALLTNARAVDVFNASLGLAAVNVIFISTHVR